MSSGPTRHRAPKARPQGWRRARQWVQVLAFLLFVLTLLVPRYQSSHRALLNLWLRLDPLVALSALIAGRIWIPGLALAGLTLLLTLVFGRVWCGWLCPLGSLLDWVRPRRTRLAPPSPRWRALKVVLLASVLAAAVLANQTLLVLDPITIAVRTFSTVVWPMLAVSVRSMESLLYRFPFLWPTLDALHASVVYPVFRDAQPAFTAVSLVAFLLVSILALNWWTERFWCRYLCPLGGLLGLLSRLSLLRRTVGDSCASCALCGGECPTGTIDPKDGFRSDPAECIVCCDCLEDCSRGGVAFRWQLPAWRPEHRRDYDPQRRQLLAGVGASLVGVALAGVEPIRRRQPADWIRPPGAAEANFESLCVRCGACVRVCPTQGLQPALFEGGIQNVMTPRLVPRLGYCDYRCNACGAVCPTGAIEALELVDKQTTPIGLARIDRSRCLPWAYSIPCIVCEEACPVPQKAILLAEVDTVDHLGEPVRLLTPYVVKELCIGCGICEYQCPMGGEAAIRVAAFTEVGGHVGIARGGQGRHRGRHVGAEGTDE